MIRQSDITQRLLRIGRSLTPAEWVAGAKWYGRANVTITALAAEHGYSPDTVAAVVAVLSPNVSWKANVSGAAKCLWAHSEAYDASFIQGSVGGFNGNVAKAFRIMDGDMSALNGPKVEAFYANLRGDSHFVTIDVWATRAAIPGRDVPRGKRERAMIDAGYRRAAETLGVAPAEFQAAVWVAVRGKSD